VTSEPINDTGKRWQILGGGGSLGGLHKAESDKIYINTITFLCTARMIGTLPFRGGMAG
jgi:hypothetical protein